MAFQDRLKDDADTIFGGHGYFEESITYTPVGGSPTVFNANVVDEFDLTDDGQMDRDFIEGLAHVVHFFISETDVTLPVVNDKIDYSSNTYRVYQFRKQSGMWQVLATSDSRVRF